MKRPNPTPPETAKFSTEQIEEAIVAVAAGAKRLLSSRLKMEAVVLLIHESIKPAAVRPTRAQIHDVLENAADLERKYLKAR